MIDVLRDILANTKELCGVQFSGVGVIVTDAPQRLPIVGLRSSSEPPPISDTASALAMISLLSSEYHDGFHILDSSMRLKVVSQYFSPPIVPDVVPDRSKLIGGRYLAALFGSTLCEVQLTGIASRDFGISVFERGSEKLFEPARC